MHIALFSPGWPLKHFHNGIVTYVDSVRPPLEALGHRISIFAASLSEFEDEHTYLVKQGRFTTAALRYARRLFPCKHDVYSYGKIIAETVLATHRRDPIDIIEMEESFGWSADVGRITSIPVLVKLHGPAFLSLIEEELATLSGQVRVEREGQALAHAAAIASPSIRTLQQTFERYQLAPAIGQHIVNSIGLRDDLPIWQLGACDPDTILFVGRFDRRKGADVLMQAFTRLLYERPKLKLLMVGPDNGLLQPDGSCVDFETYRNSLFSPVMRERVVFLGRKSNAEIAGLRVRAMATVVASRWENQSYTLLEAMAQGCPLVCSDAGGSPESVIHGRTGLLAQSEQPTDFAVQLSALLDDPQRAAALGAAARLHIMQKHAADKVAKESIALYERTIGCFRTKDPWW